MEKRQTDPEQLYKNKRHSLDFFLTFSVVMPIYNAESYLREALQSVVSQSYPYWEIIAVDDGSNDATREILEEFYKKHNNLKILQHEGRTNKGVSASRNLAVRNANGSWIALLDADDTWYPDKLLYEAQIINSYPDLVLIYSKAERIHDQFNSSKKNSLYGSGKEGEIKDAFRKLLPGFLTSTSAVTFRKDAFLKCGGFNENMRFAEDTLMFHQLMEHGNVYCIDKVLGTHRIHNSSVVSNTAVEKRITSRFFVYEQLIHKVRKENKPFVSKALVGIGLEKIFRNFLLYPHNNPKLAVHYLKRTLFNPEILTFHKIKALIFFAAEIFASPLKALWLLLRNR